jgi:hypothetical protein
MRFIKTGGHHKRERWSVACVIAGVAAILSGAPGAQVPALDKAPPIYVGVLAPVLNGSGADQIQALRVRIAFRFLDGQWRSMPFAPTDAEATKELRDQYPAAPVWTVAFDGKNLGELRTVALRSGELRPDSAWAAIQEFVPGAKPPLIREGAKAFETWYGALQVRPLVVVSHPNYADPDHWKPFQPAPQLIAQGHASFHKAVNLWLDCSGKPTSLYPDNLIQFVKAYRSSRGDALLAFRADPAQNHCYFNYDEWDSVWFYVRNGDFRLLGTGLTLIDAGDYDGDGTSELVFQKSGYNRDGYVLAHLPEASSLEFVWSYH